MKYDEAIKLTTDCKVCGVTGEEPVLYRDSPSVWVLSPDSNRRRQVGVCSNCDFWLDKWRMRGEPDVMRIAGQHYMFGEHLQDYRVTQNDTLEAIAKSYESKKNGKGMAGAKAIIRFNDGRVVITDDIWHQGNIPARFAGLLPDNATMEAV